MEITTTEQKSLSSLYNSAKFRKEWKDRVHYALVSLIDRFERKFSPYRWNSMLAYYHVDLLNFPEQKEDIYVGLISFTCMKTGLSTEEVEQVFSSVDFKVASVKSKHVPQIIVKETESTQIKLVTCGDIGYKMSTKSWEQFRSDRYFLETFLNYSFLNPESGLFWSIAQEVYSVISKVNYGIKVLECFASPFNYNLDSFCSAFASDRRLTYPKGVTCYGDFFSYIKLLKAHERPVRLIVNPPYTERLINKTAEELKSYMTSQPDGEFVAMLPDWMPQKGIETLLALEGSVFRRFAPKEFYLYDAIHQKAFKPIGMKIIIIVNLGGGDVEAGQELLDELTKQLKTMSARLA